MIKVAREQKVVKRSDYPLLSALCMNMLNELVWGKNPINFLTRGRYEKLVPTVDKAIQKSMERSLYYSDCYEKKRSENILFESFRKYIKEKNSEETTAACSEKIGDKN